MNSSSEAGSSFTPWIRHLIGPPAEGGVQHCLLCGTHLVDFAGPIPGGEVFEHDGRLFLKEPLGTVVRCTDGKDGI